MFNYFTFDGVPSTEYNCYVAQSNMFDAPKKDIKTVQVLGRNGNLHIDNDRYESFRLKLLCYIPDNMQTTIDDIRNFLLSKGTARYTEALRPNEYRNAIFIEAFEVKGSDRRGAYFNLVFDASPERYLYEGEVPVSVENINSTRTGTLISLEDTGNTTSITDAKAELEPKVYHEYDSVWLAGYGKNKLKTTATEETVNGLTFSPNDDGTIEVSGTSSEALTVTSDSEIYSKRVVENGHRLFDEIVGGSVVWNQLVDLQDQTRTMSGVTYVVSNGIITANGTSTGTSFVGTMSTFTQNHVYFFCGSPIGGGDSTYFVDTGAGLGRELGNGSIKKYTGETKEAYMRFYVRNGYTATNLKATIQLFDLTQMFGTEIADYIYNLEQSNSGSGVALFKKLFPNDYYAYNVGTIMSVCANAHELVGFNAFDKSTVTRGKYMNGSTEYEREGYAHSDYIPVLPNTVYYVSDTQASNRVNLFLNYDANKNFLGYSSSSGNAHRRQTMSNARYVIVNLLESVADDFCVNISDPVMNGTYEPYQKNTYSLSPLTLRGIPKLVDNKLVYDGDIYKSDGSVQRRYAEVDLGTLTWANTTSNRFYASMPDVYARERGTENNALCAKYTGQNEWVVANLSDKCFFIRGDTKTLYIYDSAYTDAASFKTAMNGVKLIYELATPTEETTTPFTKPQICEQGGTEEYIDNEVTQGNRDVSIPVGHNTFYADYIVSNEAKLTEGETYNVSDNLTVGYRDSSGMHTTTNTVTIPSGGEYEFSAYTGDGASIEPMISTSSTTPFEPYENIGYLEEYSSATLKIEPKNIYPLENGMAYDSGLFIQINDGEVRLTGNATSRTRHYLGNVVNVTGTYIASGGIAEGNSKLIVRKINTLMGHSTVTDYDIYTEDVTIPVSRLGTTTLQFYLDIANGSGDGLVFKPMLRNPLITDSTFEKGVDGSRAELCLFDPAATGGEYSFYHRTLTETHKAIDISTLTWSIATTRGELTVFTASLPSTADVTANINQHFCTGMAVAYGLQSNVQEATFTIYKSGNAQSSVVYLAYKTSEVPDVATLTSLIEGIYLNYKLYTPTSTNYGPEGAIYPITNATTYFYSPYEPSDLSSIVDYHELEISYTSPTVIENPTGMKAYPLIQIVPTDDTDGYVRINGATIFVKMNGVLNHGVYFFDTEIQDAYYGDYENANQWIYTLDSSIFFKEGKNVVTFENVDRVVIYPRWWKL